MAGTSGVDPAFYALDVAARTGEIDRSGLFGSVEHRLVRWVGTHTGSQIRAMFASFSPWMALGDDLRESVLDEVEQLAVDEFHDRVQRPYLTALYLARRR